MVIWFIGLSGSGKTLFSKKLYNILKPNLPNLVRIDGDLVREMFNNDVDHTINGRLKNAHRISHLTKYLSDQNIHVIAAVLSNFPEWQSWNRSNIKDYYEIYLKSNIDTLYTRDNKNLYGPALEGKLKDVVGVDIAFKEPKQSDLIIDNSIDKSIQEIFSTILNQDFIKIFLKNEL